MEKDVEVAVIFSRRYLKERNITVLVPEKAVTGKCIQDSKFFIDNVENKKFKNMDEANYQNQQYGFYYATSLKKLQDQYETKDLQTILQKYIDEICTKVHYYVNFDEEDFESYLLKNLSIEDFNKEYSVSFKYNFLNEQDQMLSKKKNTKNKNTTNVKCSDLLGKDILNIKNNLNKQILFQNKALDKIVKALYNNYILGNKDNNILISGPSGVGKTKALKVIEECSNHPVVYVSLVHEYADENTSSDYIFNNLLLRLRDNALDNHKADDHSIIILDDFDKLDDFQKLDFQDELYRFLNTGIRGIKANQKLIFYANKITFIMCGNFEEADKAINIPKDFYERDNFKVDEEDLSLNQNNLIENYLFLDKLLPYFQTEVMFENLDLKKAKEIIKTLQNNTLALYINQLVKQGVKNITLTDEFVEELAKCVYSNQLNLNGLDISISNLFTDIMVDSLNYLGVPTELTISKEILQKDKKGYQFTLKK